MISSASRMLWELAHRMKTRIVSKYTGDIYPDRIFIVQIARRGFLGRTVWVSVKGFERITDARDFERSLR